MYIIACLLIVGVSYGLYRWIKKESQPETKEYKPVRFERLTGWSLPIQYGRPSGSWDYNKAFGVMSNYKVDYFRIFATIPFSLGREVSETGYNITPWKVDHYRAIPGESSPQPVWDLNVLEDLWYKRVLDLVKSARTQKNPIIICICLHDNWSARDQYNRWMYCPSNNIQGISAKVGSCDHRESDNPEVMFHTQYIFVDRLLWDLKKANLIDGVIFEVSNEGQEKNSWFKLWVDTIRNISKDFPVKISINVLGDKKWWLADYVSLHNATRHNCLTKAEPNIIMSSDGVEDSKRYDPEEVYYACRATLDLGGLCFDIHDTRYDLKTAEEASNPPEDLFDALYKAKQGEKYNL